MEKTMAVTYPNSAAGTFDDIVDIFATKVINVLYQIVSLTKKFAGIIGLVFLSILLLLVIPFIFLFLKRTNTVTRKRLKEVYNWINVASEPDLRYAHLSVEKRNKSFRTLISKKKVLDKNILTMGVSNQTNLLATQLFDLEDSLKKAAYPNYDKELSDEDLEELLSIFEEADID